MKKVAKSRRPQAERASEHLLRNLYGCVVTRRAVRTQWQSVDFFGCDIVGKKEDGTHIYAQVTAGQDQAVRVRRKKLDKFPWHETDTVYVLQLVERQSVENPRRKDWYFRIYAWKADRTWTNGECSVKVPAEWFKAWK